MNTLTLIGAGGILSTVVASIAWMVVSIKRLIIMRQLTERALDNCTKAQIPSVLRASADLASTLTSDRRLGQPSDLVRRRRSRSTRR